VVLAPYAGVAALGVLVTGGIFWRAGNAGWLFNRFAAGAVLSMLTALLDWAAVCAILWAGPHGQNLGLVLILGLLMAGSCFAMVGTIATFMLLCAPPAKAMPWRSLPVLLVGTTLAGLAVILPLLHARRGLGDPLWTAIAMWAAAVWLGGFAAASLRARR
jgi:hypothetical protein